MNLREQILIDNQRTFLNTNEFADLYIINGAEVKASLDSSTDSKHPLAYAEGVSLVTDVLFVDLLELGYKPKEDEWLNINGTDHRVVRVASEKGMLTIYLEANTG